MGSLFGMSKGHDLPLMQEMGNRLRHRGVNREVFPISGGGMISGYSEGLANQPWMHEGFAMAGSVNLFNAEEVFRLLRDRGFQPASDDAGQLLLSAWAVLGPESLQRINGDFAIAIADLDKGTIHLARDRSGTQPLYYMHFADRWFFASEYKALLSVPDLVPEIDLKSMQMLHTRKVVPAGHTLLKNVLQVPAQSIVTLGNSTQSRVNQYWHAGGEVEPADFGRHRDRISNAFLQAIKRRTENFERIGISLSGGVDSIAMVAATRKLRPEASIKTYTIGDNIDDPEVTVARRVAEFYDTEHHEYIFSTDNLAERMQDLVWALEDPIARTETLMTYDICARACKNVDIMLRGDGADGLFGGMARHKILALAQRIPPATSILIDVYNYTQSGNMPDSLISRALIQMYFRSKIPEPPTVIGYSDEAPRSNEDFVRKELLNRILWKGPEHALPMLLQKVERPHARFGMQTVSPFLDNDLVDAANKVPSLFKNNGKRGKIVFREAVRQFVPEEFARVPKYAQRVRETAEICDALDTVARDFDLIESLTRRKLFHQSELTRLLKRSDDGLWPPEHAMRVWTLILTEFWSRVFIDKRAETAGT